MTLNNKTSNKVITKDLLTFFAITLFYFFEVAQMSYFNVLAPGFLSHGIFSHDQIASLSAAYYYGDMVGLLPVGLALDRYPLRKILLWAIAGSILSAFLLLVSKNFHLQYLARFLCGFFGGTFSFVGGIRVLAAVFPNRFTFFMGLFLSAGMFGALVCQYPLLVVVDHFGEKAAMAIVAVFGLLVMMINLFYLHPVNNSNVPSDSNRYPENLKQTWLRILSNYRNWLDCLMVVLLDTPVSILGTLWGVVVIMSYYHFSDVGSAWIIMSLFAGLIIGLPMWGHLADRFNYPAWIIILGSLGSSVLISLMLLMSNSNILTIAILFFGLGFFSSCQTLGFTWLIKGMQPELIGINSAFNSIIFMGTNGAFKQITASLLVSAPLIRGYSSASNILIMILIAMIITIFYSSIRSKLVNKISLSSVPA